MSFRISPVVEGEKAAWYARHYDDVEDDIHTVFEKLDTPFLDARLHRGMLVLDPMMGHGRHAVRYAKRGCVVWGNDLNRHMVRLARKAARDACVKATFSALDATTLRGVPAGHFDAVIVMFSALGTIPTDAARLRALRAFVRVTKPGGMVIVHAHNLLDTLLDPEYITWGWQTLLFPEPGLERGDMVTDYNGLKEMYNHFYRPGELRRAFRKAGIRVTEEHYLSYDPPAFMKGPFKRLRADGFIFVGRKA
jgi:ubiquinone/menaquinone biosynthesis C-methylase UbiE